MSVVDNSLDIVQDRFETLGSFIRQYETSLKVLAVALGAVLPFFLTTDYTIHIFVLILIYTLSAIGYDITLGQIGIVHLAQAPMMAAAGYTSALLMMGWDFPFIVAGFAGIGAAVLMAILIGLPALRLHGLYYALVSLAIAELFRLIVKNSTEITQGPLGLSPIPSIQFAGVTVTTVHEYYYFLFAIVVVGMYVKYRIRSGYVGKAFAAINNNEDLAKSVGINTPRYKLLSFVINGTYAGVSGVLYAHYIGLMVPFEAEIVRTNDYLIMTVLGGMNTLFGSLVGSVFVVLVPELFRVVENFRLILFGITLILIILYFPKGIVGSIKNLLDY